jgi:hypothetical protein
MTKKWDKYIKEQYDMIKVGGLIYHHIAQSWRIITDVYWKLSDEGIMAQFVTYLNFEYMEYTTWPVSHLKYQLEMQQATMYA